MADHMCIEDEGNGGNNIINMDIKEIEKTSVIPLIKQESTASELIAQPEEAGGNYKYLNYINTTTSRKN